MAVNIFERYGIKEVANVYFEALDSEPEAGIAKGDIVLYLDTLKVSTIETTAENVSAQGGWGNPKLVTWDYGKDINVTLEDAVISWEEMRILMGALMKKGEAQKGLKIRKNALVVVEKGASAVEFEAGSGLTNKGHHELPGANVKTGKFVDMTNGVRGTAAFTFVDADEETGTKAKMTVALTSNNEAYVPNTTNEAAKIRLFWEDEASEEAQNATELIISPDRYPGTGHGSGHGPPGCRYRHILPFAAPDRRPGSAPVVQAVKMTARIRAVISFSQITLRNHHTPRRSRGRGTCFWRTRPAHPAYPNRQ